MEPPQGVDDLIDLIRLRLVPIRLKVDTRVAYLWGLEYMMAAFDPCVPEMLLAHPNQISEARIVALLLQLGDLIQKLHLSQVGWYYRRYYDLNEYFKLPVRISPILDLWIVEKEGRPPATAVRSSSLCGRS